MIQVRFLTAEGATFRHAEFDHDHFVLLDGFFKLYSGMRPRALLAEEFGDTSDCLLINASTVFQIWEGEAKAGVAGQ